MEGQEYLNQISATNRPTTKAKGGLFSSKFFKLGMIGLIIFLLIAIFGAILGSGKGGEKELSFALKLHLDNTTSIITEYQPSVKSSILRSNSASLYGVLSNADKKLTDYITEKYDYKEKNVNKKILSEAATAKDALSTELFNAKINGILDRIYAHKMAYEISLIMTEEAKIINMTKNDDLKEAFNSSYGSLENLYSKFNDYSETK